MAKLLETISDFNDLILQGKHLEAFEKYYHDDVVIQEDERATTLGKKANRIHIKEFLDSMAEFGNPKLLRVAVGQSFSIVEWQYDFKHKDYGEVSYTQISVQEWEDKKIVKEKFYCNSIFSSKIKVDKGSTLIVLFNLKEGTNEDDYEKFAKEIDSPTIKKLPSNYGFKILKGINLFGSENSSPYQYIEVMNISSFRELALDIQKEEVQKMLKQFSSFADNPQLIVTKQIN